MAVKFISHVDESSNGQWYIQLTDTLSDETVICQNLDEYKVQIEKMGDEYGNDIEVEWTKSKTLSPKSYQELNEQMEILQKEYESEIQELNQNENNGFNPNA